jgi:SAM-dependent methyltransferase
LAYAQPVVDPYPLALPPEHLQARITTTTGDEALALGFKTYSLFRRLYEEQAGPLTPSHRILDFGCGWGRVTRFFLRDIAPENLVGIDVDEEAIAACRETNPWARFEHCERFPPTVFESRSFDLVYAYSVFSHLSEEAHMRWLEEFERILKPGGLVIVTTLPRTVIEQAEAWADHDIPWRRAAAAGFAPTKDWLAAYDRGEFCFAPLPENPHFGLAAIPERYARKAWSQHFLIRDFGKLDPGLQPVIVCERL